MAVLGAKTMDSKGRQMMSILVDFEIRHEIESKRLIIEPYEEKLIQPNSIDIRLGHQFTWYDDLSFAHNVAPIDPYDISTQGLGVNSCENMSRFTIVPGQFVLAATMEKVCLPKNLVGQLTGKSSIARLGIMVHVTAGFIDAGFSHPPATITLEIVNVGNRPVILHAGMPIGQLVFTRTLMCEKAYHEKADAKYNGQRPAAVSKYHMNQKA
jgi:dCTP deaminase